MNCVVFTQLVIKRCNATLVKKQTCWRQLKLITRLSNTRDLISLRIITNFQPNLFNI